ncbi:MAG: hypothetical protein Q7T49_02015 [bacterium]|nr:hypothetical protein [bacterium]
MNTGKLDCFDVTMAVSRKQARNNVRWRHFGETSVEDLEEDHQIILHAAEYGSARDIELFNQSRPGQKPVKHYRRQEFPQQQLLPGMGRNAQLL